MGLVQLQLLGMQARPQQLAQQQQAQIVNGS
jgi:hypothetical protein